MILIFLSPFSDYANNSNYMANLPMNYNQQVEVFSQIRNVQREVIEINEYTYIRNLKSSSMNQYPNIRTLEDKLFDMSVSGRYL